MIISSKIRRKRRISLNIRGNKERPRISIFRSNHYIYVQAIDDINRTSLASFSSLLLVKNNKQKMKKSDEAREVGVKLSQILKEKKIDKAVFDRGCYSYNGRVKALAEGLRKGGIKI